MPFILKVVGAAATIIAALATLPLSHSKETWPKGLSMDEFNTILSTDIYEEFGTKPEHLAKSLWDDATDFEWKQSKEAEISHVSSEKSSATEDRQNLRFSNGKNSMQETTPEGIDKHDFAFPYVVCQVEFGKSGYEIRSDIESHFGSDLTLLYNNDDKTCFFAYVPASVAQNAPESMVVQPLLAEMKIGAGTVQSVMENQHSKFQALLCPGLAGTEVLSKNIGHSIIKSLKNGRNNDSKKTMVTERFLRTELESLQDETKFGKHDINAFLTDRKHLWRTAFDDGLNSDNQCNDMFRNMYVSGAYKGESFVVGISEDGKENSPTSKSSSPACLLSLVAGLATSREVCSIGILSDNELLNHQAQWIVQSKVNEYRPWFDSGLTGKNQVVAISDSGLDTKNCYFWDSTGRFRKDGSIDVSRRKVVQYDPFINSRDDPFIGHGTHVSGTVAGRRSYDGQTQTTGISDGMARDAKIAFFDAGILGALVIAPPNVENLFDPGRRAGANLHSASWGAPKENGYDFQARSFDDYMFDNQDFLVIVAAGNSGDKPVPDSPYTVGAPSTAKNVISVGACESAGPDILEENLMGFEYLAYFSSRGPTADGRTKPDIVAPGYNILSAKSHWNNYSCDGKDGSKMMAGTSMATPVVSGTAALVRQYFEEGWYPTGKPDPTNSMVPSGALVKAVLMNGAQYLKGVNNNGTITSVEPYDNSQNFGRISMIDSLHLDLKNNMDVIVFDRKIIDVDDTHNITVKIDNSGDCKSMEISATLVWTDPPAVANCRKCLLNDLDLYVSKYEDSLERIFPNGLSTRDNINNAERVQVTGDDGDLFVISVEAHDLATATQNYALVVSGCVVEVS